MITIVILWKCLPPPHIEVRLTSQKFWGDTEPKNCYHLSVPGGGASYKSKTC